MALKRKRKHLGDDDHYANCDLHQNDEQRDMQCPGTTKKGNRCQTYIRKPSDLHLNKYHQLPKCARHSDQFHMKGKCEATAACGEKCDRIVAAEPGYNQLCPEHLDLKLTPHLMRLPTELRLNIMGYCLPEGVNGTAAVAGLDEDAMNLLLVNRQIMAETRTFLYTTRTRPGYVAVDSTDSTVWILGYNYVSIADLHKYEGRRSFSALNPAAFTPYQHIVILVNGSNWLRADSKINELLEAFNWLLHALPSSGNAIQSVKVLVTFPGLPTGEERSSLQILKLLTYFASTVDIGSLSLEWSIMFSNFILGGQVEDIGVHPPSEALLNAYSKRCRDDEYNDVKDDIKCLQEILSKKSQHIPLWNELWQAYKHIYAIIEVLCSLKIDYRAHEYCSLACGPKHNPSAIYPISHALAMAQEARQSKDLKALGHVLEGLQDKMRALMAPMQLVLGPDHDGQMLKKARRLLSPDISMDNAGLEYLTDTHVRLHSDEHSKVEDFVYKVYYVHGEPKYRLLTPLDDDF